MTDMQSDNFRMPAQTAANNLQQAEWLAKEGRLEEAIPLYESALANLERTNGMEAPELAECLQNLAEAYQSVARYEDSLRTNWRLVRIGEKILGRVHPDMVSMLLKIAQTNEMMGKTEDALHIVESAIATAKQCMQSDNPLAVKLIERHTYLVNLLRNQGASKSQYDDPSLYQGNSAQLPPQPQIHNPNPNQNQGANTPQNQVQIPSQLHQQMMQYEVPQPQAAAPNGAYQHPAQVPVQKISVQPHPMEISMGHSDMQNFAREMLKDMPGPPGSKSPFSQSVNLGNASGVNYEEVTNPQEALALDPRIAPMPLPPQRPQGLEKQASYGNALAQRPSQDFDSGEEEEEPYTAEAIASLTNRNKPSTRSNAKGRRLSDSEQSRIRVGRVLKDFGLPLVALIVLVGMVFYIFKSSKPAAPVKPATAAVPRGQLTLFEGPDGKKQLRLLGTEVAYLVSQNAATKVPYKRIGNNWSDYFAITFGSLTEKQLWFEEEKSSLKGEDGSIYYGVDGPENIVLEKMRDLGGFAQSYFLRTGEYPKMVPPGADFAFSYISPYSGKGLSIPIRTVRAKEKDCSDVLSTLEGGNYLGNEETATPGYICAYAATYGDNATDTMKCVKFFVRGCRKDGRFLMTDHDKIFVLTADNSFLKQLAPSVVDKKADKVPLRTSVRNRKSKKAAPPVVAAAKNFEIPKAKSQTTTAIDQAVYSRAEPPEKPTQMYLIMNPPVPLGVLHHLVPLLLLLLTFAAFIRSQMVGFDIKGQAVSTGSNAAVLVAGISFLLLAVSVLIQFAIFR